MYILYVNHENVKTDWEKGPIESFLLKGTMKIFTKWNKVLARIARIK